MSELERLRSETAIARCEIIELQCKLALIEQRLGEMQERLTLSDHERTVLAGEADGCIRLGDLTPIVRRVFGGAA